MLLRKGERLSWREPPWPIGETLVRPTCRPHPPSSLGHKQFPAAVPEGRLSRLMALWNQSTTCFCRLHHSAYPRPFAMTSRRIWPRVTCVMCEEQTVAYPSTATQEENNDIDDFSSRDRMQIHVRRTVVCICLKLEIGGAAQIRFRKYRVLE